MTASELAKAARAVPFRPFELVTGDGQRFRVPTSDHFSIGPAKRLATVWLDDDSHSILDVDLITHVTILSGTAPPRKTPRR